MEAEETHSRPDVCGDDTTHDWDLCIEGTIYGPCVHENCGGMCEPQESCSCSCHVKKTP